MWSDPDDDDSISNWKTSPRGVGFWFGQKQVNEFCHVNSLKLIARSHQLIMEGYKERFAGTFTTVWSAPNYCYRAGNKASTLIIYDLTKQPLSSRSY